MADMDYYGADYGTEAPSRLMEAARNFGFVNWAGALTSLTLTAGMAVWAVDLTFRDVSGVPVIRAMEGPMRERPADPGGRVAPYQGMALSDITSGGAAAPAPDAIVLAPPPVALDAPALGERIAAAAPATTPPAEAEVAAAAPGPALEVTEVVSLASPATDTVIELTEQVLVGASAPTAQPVPSPVFETPPATVEAVAAATPIISPNEPGIAVSSRPRQRPAGLRQVAATVPTDIPSPRAGVEVVSASPDVPATRSVDPASVPVGTRVVQLGAFDSEAIALSEWERLEGRFRDYMVGKSRMIQKARSGGRDFWRLRVVGFEDASDARRFCSELLARDAACIPVTVR